MTKNIYTAPQSEELDFVAKSSLCISSIETGNSLPDFELITDDIIWL